MESGIYFLDKLSLTLEPRLELLTTLPFGLMFALKNVNSTARLDLPDNKCLFAGVEEMSTLFLQFGTKSKKVFFHLLFSLLSIQTYLFYF